MGATNAGSAFTHHAEAVSGASSYLWAIGLPWSVPEPLCGCLCCLLDFGRSDIRWVSLHAEGGNLEQNRLLQVYSFSAMDSYVES
jgi:hypothetical protein